MTSKLRRRTILAGGAAAALAARLPKPAIAEDRPVKIGLLTVKTGPLAQGGFQMEQGVALFLKHSGNKLAGRPTEPLIADTGGNPAGTKTKAQELRSPRVQAKQPSRSGSGPRRITAASAASASSGRAPTTFASSSDRTPLVRKS